MKRRETALNVCVCGSKYIMYKVRAWCNIEFLFFVWFSLTLSVLFVRSTIYTNVSLKRFKWVSTLNCGWSQAQLVHRSALNHTFYRLVYKITTNIQVGIMLRTTFERNKSNTSFHISSFFFKFHMKCIVMNSSDFEM